MTTSHSSLTGPPLPATSVMLGRSKTTVRRKPVPPIPPDLVEQELVPSTSPSPRLKHSSTFQDIRSSAAQNAHLAKIPETRQYHLDYHESKQDEPCSLLDLLGKETTVQIHSNHIKFQLPWKFTREAELPKQPSSEYPTFNSLRKLARQASVRIRRGTQSSNSDRSPGSISSPSTSPTSTLRRSSTLKLSKADVSSPLNPIHISTSTACARPLSIQSTDSIVHVSDQLAPQQSDKERSTTTQNLGTPCPLRPERSIRRPPCMPIARHRHSSTANATATVTATADPAKRQAIYADGKAVFDDERHMVLPTILVHGDLELELESLLAPSMLDLQQKTAHSDHLRVRPRSVWSASSNSGSGSDGASDADDNCFSSSESAHSSISWFDH